MTKRSLAREVAEVWDEPVRYEYFYDASFRTVDAVFEAIKAALKRGEKVQIKGFGTFRPNHIPAKRAKNLVGKGKKNRLLPARTKAAFRPSPSLRAAIAPPRDPWLKQYDYREYL